MSTIKPLTHPSKPQKLTQQSNPGELILGTGFALQSQPVALQLTVHVQNCLLTFGTGSIGSWKELLTNPEKINDESLPLTVRQIVSHYGIKNVQQWFTTVYGWTFATKKSVNNKVVNKAV
jgi:hypothetical protein